MDFKVEKRPKDMPAKQNIAGALAATAVNGTWLCLPKGKNLSGHVMVMRVRGLRIRHYSDKAATYVWCEPLEKKEAKERGR